MFRGRPKILSSAERAYRILNILNTKDYLTITDIEQKAGLTLEKTSEIIRENGGELLLIHKPDLHGRGSKQVYIFKALTAGSEKYPCGIRASDLCFGTSKPDCSHHRNCYLSVKCKAVKREDKNGKSKI